MYLGFWFWFSLIVLFLLLISFFYLWKFATLVLDVQDSIEVSLDVLDKRYKAMSEILEIPIFFDSMEVRKCIAEIKKSREAILYVANVMTDPVNKEEYENNLNLIEGIDGEKKS
jgi:hypothetical protein